MNVSIGKNLEAYIEWQLKNGPFNSASEIVRDALRLHQLRYAELRSRMDPGSDLEEWGRELGERSKDEGSDDTDKSA